MNKYRRIEIANLVEKLFKDASERHADRINWGKFPSEVSNLIWKEMHQRYPTCKKSDVVAVAYNLTSKLIRHHNLI